MCLLVFAWRHAPAQRLVLAGNRDEFHARPTAPMHWWESPRLLAGRDLQAGGTWLALGEHGRFAVVTNFRGPPPPAQAPSRGALIPDWFASGAAPRAWLDALANDGVPRAGFSLVLGDGEQVAYWSNHDAGGPRTLAPGVYGLSNGLLDAPWPKLVRTRERFAAALAAAGAGTPGADALFAVLGDRSPAADHELPDTGLGRARERVLSAPFIVGPEYGTRSATVASFDGHGRLRHAVERSYAPDGTLASSRDFAVAARAA